MCLCTKHAFAFPEGIILSDDFFFPWCIKFGAFRCKTKKLRLQSRIISRKLPKQQQQQQWVN